MERIFNHEIMREIKERWSPRAFSDKAVSEADLMALLEAARYAPSSSNEQPWRFVIANDEEKLAKMRAVLNAGNQEWASMAPVLILIAAEKICRKNGNNNRWNCFDSGTAWGYLSLEAQRRGLITHGMGGFSVEKAQEAFNIADHFDIIAVIAIGYYGSIDQLSDFNTGREKPNTRKEIDELIL